jgi:hypothetical protein
MNSAELDRLWQGGTHKVVSAEITKAPGPLPAGVFEQAPRVIATLDDGRQIELFSFYAHERSFAPEVFVGLTVDEARRLKFAPEYRLTLGPRMPPKRSSE